MKILSVCIGDARPSKTKSGQTGHFKQPVAGGAQIGRNGLEGDRISVAENMRNFIAGFSDPRFLERMRMSW